MEELLQHQFVDVVESAAIACAHTMGLGDRPHSDRAAVEAMRQAMQNVPMDGTIVIGEGERDEAPMLYIGEKVGRGPGDAMHEHPEVDIAVDPLEGTNLCATGTNNAMTVLAVSEKDGLLHAPDCYMQKIIVGPSSRGAIDIDAPVKENLKAIARRLERDLDTGDPSDGSADPPDRRRRPIRRHFRRGSRDGGARGHGDRRCSRGRPDGGSPPLPAWGNASPAGDGQARSGEAPPGHGH